MIEKWEKLRESVNGQERIYDKMFIDKWNISVGKLLIDWLEIINSVFRICAREKESKEKRFQLEHTCKIANHYDFPVHFLENIFNTDRKVFTAKIKSCM